MRQQRRPHEASSGMVQVCVENFMSSRIRTITIDCAAWQPLVGFWSAATRYREDPANPNLPDDPEGLLIDPDGGPSLLFQVVPEEKVTKNRVHLDLEPQTTRDAEVARLLDLGATL